MDVLLFDSENLKGTLGSLKEEVNKLDIVMEGIKSRINSINQIWSGEAEKEISKHFEDMLKSLNALNEKASVYVAFLNKTISGYEETDSTSHG